MSWKATVLLIASVALSAECQLVQVGPVDPDYCKKLQVEPNLVVDLTTEIIGRLVDASGEPFKNSPVEVRMFLSPQKQSVLTMVKTDRDGHFNISRQESIGY